MSSDAEPNKAKRVCGRCGGRAKKKVVVAGGRELLLCVACFDHFQATNASASDAPTSPRADAPISPRAAAPTSAHVAAPTSPRAADTPPELRRERSAGLARFVPRGLRKKKSTAGAQRCPPASQPTRSPHTRRRNRLWRRFAVRRAILARTVSRISRSKIAR